jgi:MATE family multidrug resistance protein
MFCHLFFYWLVGLPLGAYLCFRLGWGAPGLWTGLSVALILIGSTLLYFWRRKEKSFATMPFPASTNLNPIHNPTL